MPTTPTLRPARPGDADSVVPLIVEAMDVLALELAGVDTLAAAWPIFRELFVLRGHRYSHERMWVLEDGGVLAGALLAYPGREEATLAATTLAWLSARTPGRVLRHQQESRPDEFYLDALAIAPAQRGRGHAARLIEGACAAAHAAGHARVGLLVDDGKPGVRRLYARLGFVVDGHCDLAGHHYAHMSRAAVAAARRS